MATASRTGDTLAQCWTTPHPRLGLRPGFQFAGDLIPSAGQDLPEVASIVRSVVCDWIQAGHDRRLPDAAFAGDSFDSDAGGRIVECVSLPAEGIWSVRLTDSAASSKGGRAGATRAGSTQIAIARGDTSLRLGTHVAVPHGADGAIPRARPDVLLELADRFSLREAAPIAPVAWRPQTEDDLDRLHALLTSPARGLPVYLLTEPERHRLEVPRLDEFLLDHRWLARELLGLAYVVTMPWKLSFAWTERVGKLWSAFRGAVRTYRPGLDFDNDAPTHHPRILPNRVLAFRYNDALSERAFEQFLVDRAYEHSAARWVTWEPCLLYADARRRKAERARAQVKEDADWRNLYDEEIAALKAKIDQLEDERSTSLGLADAAERERDQIRDENRRLRARLDVMTRAVESRAATVSDVLSFPDTYDETTDWVDAHLTGRLVLHPRAINRGLKHAEFDSPATVHRILYLLATDYRDMRLGRAGAKAKLERQLDAMNLRLTGSIAPERAGAHGETYYVRYPLNSSPRRFLEHHVRSRANTRNPTRCLALYFFWDGDTQQVVVGWLPGHLENRMT